MQRAPKIPALSKVVACLGGRESQIESRTTPVPAAGELLLKMRLVGFCGTDLFKLDSGQTTPGMVLGHELVGEVAAIGTDVSGFDLGDRVAVPHHVPCGKCPLCLRGSETMCDVFRENLLSPGGFAEYLVVRPRAVQQCTYKLPTHVSDEAAAFIEPGACVMRGLQRAQIPASGLAAILGAGSMGLLHLLILRAYMPTARVLVVDPVAERRAQALELGATAATSPGDPAIQSALTLSNNLGVDAVFDTVGGNRTLSAALDMSRQGGTVVLFAHAPDGERAEVDLNNLFKYERRLLGTYSGSVREQRAVFELITSGSFDPTPLISHRLPLDRFAKGVELARSRQALKILFTPTSETQ